MTCHRSVNGYHSARMTLKVIIHSAEEGGFWAEVPSLPGCVSQGETIEEVRANVARLRRGQRCANEVRLLAARVQGGHTPGAIQDPHGR